MSQTPFFSVVIVNYNYGQYLEEAICSIIDQSINDYEIILVDGGSTDDSLRIIEKYSDKFAWWVSEPDSGQSEAFNKGFAKAKGKFLTWLNSDDIMLPGTLAAAKRKLVKNEACNWLTGNLIKILNDNTIYESKWGPHYLPKFLQRESAPAIVFGPSSFFRRELFIQVGRMDQELHYMMDTDLWIRFMMHGVKQVRLNHYCWAFRIHERSKTAMFENSLINEKHAEDIAVERGKMWRKNGYTISGVLKWGIRAWRILDMSALVYVYRQRNWRGRDYRLVKFSKE